MRSIVKYCLSGGTIALTFFAGSYVVKKLVLSKVGKYLVLLALLLICGFVIGRIMYDNVVGIAKQYVGEKEKSANTGFNNSQFEADMKSVGWASGSSWCVYFAKLMWKKALASSNPKVWNAANSLIGGNSQATWANFVNDKSGLFKTSNVPKVGSIAIWQNYDNGTGKPTGHAGIVTSVGSTKFATIEGNTNNDGSANGDGVYARERSYNFSVNNGLRLKGFINIV